MSQHQHQARKLSPAEGVKRAPKPPAMRNAREAERVRNLKNALGAEGLKIYQNGLKRFDKLYQLLAK